ncbi:MAG: N-acetyltransferase [Clostridia bacterium]|nr:N-acetyltransferase [Clostridia bacterium]
MKPELANIIFREITAEDDAALANIIRRSLEAHGLDIPGTAYFDAGLDHLSRFYLENPAGRYYCILSDAAGNVLGGVGIAECACGPGIAEHECATKAEDCPGSAGADRAEAFECCELQKLYLTPSARGLGLGAQLVRIIENKARELGYRAIYLETHDNLAAAVKTYETCGYREIRKPAGVVHSAMNRFFAKRLEQQP